ncbi:ABC transporter ATP-binding protein [Streptomyces sp. NRRL F-5135]|uniref:ABC transporter ATP-binding protein n=1 Tax=Streptomyces sp. NRRL F-5135 TaxID=1463858 RepID=UPI00099E0CF2|nr:ABC transporter ATP-binding protein [Streptomyces sp. NRRL F-5135]
MFWRRGGHPRTEAEAAAAATAGRAGAGPASGTRSPAGALVLEGVHREYKRGVPALRPLDLTVPSGRFLAVMGPSGCGKSTLLQCAAGLDRPTGGTVRIGGTDLSSLSETRLTRLRRERLGFVFQAHNLVPSLSVLENVVLPLMLGGTAAGDELRARDALAAVGLAERAGASPAELSGGQSQRVAIARALVTRPDIVFADEPTGALDPATAQEVLALLRRAVDRDGHTVVMVTHDPVAAARADEILFLERGRVVDCLEGADPDQVRRFMGALGRDGERRQAGPVKAPADTRTPVLSTAHAGAAR